MKDLTVTAGIICPVPIEYRTCRDSLRLKSEVELMGRLISSRSAKGINVIAVEAGPGKIQSASATQFIIDQFKPDIMMDVGAAGSLSPQVSIFDVVCAEYSYEYDICSLEKFSRFVDDLTTHTILSDLSEDAQNILHQFAERVRSEKLVGFEIGNIACGERVVNKKAMREELHSAFQAIACNWETSAVLKTAQLNGVKAISFRVITDRASEEMSKELKTNWKKALKVLFPVVGEFLFGGWLLRILKCL